MTREATLQDRAKRLFKTRLTPYLAKRGFKKDGRIYSHQNGRIQHLIDIQQSSHNSKDAISFTLNCGIHIPNVWSCFTQGPEPTRPDAADGILTARPGLIMVPKGTQWWDMRRSDPAEKDAALGDDIISVLEEGAFRRFFDRFQRESDVAEFLSQPRSKADQQMFPANLNMCTVYAGIIWDQLGEYEKCKECMARAAEQAKGKRLEVDIEKFAREYVCGKLPRIESS